MKRENIPIIIGFILSMSLLYKGEKSMNNTVDYWALVVAIVTVAGTLIAHFISFRKDSNTIGEVKSDTSKLVPQVNNIDENTKKIREQVTEQMVPTLNQLQDARVGVSELVEELHYQNRLKQETSPYINNMDTFITGIKNIYEENARLSSELKKERDKNQLITLEYNSLRIELEDYRNRYHYNEKDNGQEFE